MTREYKKLNSTGSLLKHVPTNTIYSYSTPIYRKFTLSNGKVLRVFNDTYYSATTRKHQANIREYEAQSDIVFHYCPYGNWSLDTAFKNEITMTKCKIEELENKKRKLTLKQSAEYAKLKSYLYDLQNLYAEV